MLRPQTANGKKRAGQNIHSNPKYRGKQKGGQAAVFLAKEDKVVFPFPQPPRNVKTHAPCHTAQEEMSAMRRETRDVCARQVQR